MGAAPWKTVVILLVLLTAIPAAIFLYNALTGEGTSGIGLGVGEFAGSPEEVLSLTPVPLVCRGTDEFEIRNTTVEATKDCCTASVIGQISNNCDRSLSAVIAAALVTAGSGRIIAIGNSEGAVSSLGSGESTFFRVDFSGKAGWAAAQRDDVVPDVRARIGTVPTPAPTPVRTKVP